MSTTDIAKRCARSIMSQPQPVDFSRGENMRRRPADTSVLVIVLFFHTLCVAQSASPAQKLTGRTHHVWVYERLERIMGAGDNCKRGEEDDFSSDHEVTITRCENGKLVRTKQTWSIRNDGIDDWVKIGTEEYQLLFTADGKTMTLRKVSTEKPMATEDKDYRRQSE